MSFIHQSIVVLAILWLNTGLCQTPDQFARNAAAFTAVAAVPTTTIRKSYSGDSWVKIVAKITHATWDVKKTDSVLDPIVGVVNLRIESGVSGRKATQNEAENASLTESDFDSEQLEIYYTPTDKGWAFSKGRRFSKAVGASREIKLPPPNSPFIPYAWAVQGYAVSK